MPMPSGRSLTEWWRHILQAETLTIDVKKRLHEAASCHRQPTEKMPIKVALRDSLAIRWPKIAGRQAPAKASPKAWKIDIAIDRTPIGDTSRPVR